MTLEVGDRAPGFELPDTDGAQHSLDAGDHGATVVYWTCNHCPYALAWHERMLDVARDYTDRNVRVLAINSNNPESHPADAPEKMAERVRADGGWTHPYLWDETQEVAREWRAEKTPHVFVVDRERILRYRGAPDADYDDATQNAQWLRDALDAVLDGLEPDPPVTPAVGCSIKWR